MGKIGYGYGSEWHLLRYLGYHRNFLSEKVLQVTDGQNISWLDFGFSNANVPLNNDRELVGLEFIKDPHVLNRWKKFWPQTGTSQNWDAVGKIDHDEWLLVEAKGHFNEAKSTCNAKSTRSIEMINTAFTRTISAFCDQPAPIENWLTPYYQYANRLTVLYFLMKECDPAISARLLFIHFYGDHRPDTECPQTAAEWHPLINEMNKRLNIDKNSELNNRVHHLFLPVNPV